MFPRSAAFALVIALTGAAPAQPRGPDLHESTVPGVGAVLVTGEIWVDNWFAMYLNGEKLIEDSTPYETERSFNAERVTFNTDLPVTIGFELRDFMENATGLEYIGTRRQQMGDGGAIFQFRDASGRLLAVSGLETRCIVVQHAPFDPGCAKARDPGPSVAACAATVAKVSGDWTAPGFDDSGWPAATVHSARDVGPKDGYDLIRWDGSARLIWGPSLTQDNVLLCRAALR